MSKRVLLVDDSETVLQFERMILRGLGLELSSAKNGVQALDQIAVQKPDLVLLDIMMPDMDGIETLRRLKESPSMQNIPVVVVTTKGDPELVKQAFEVGCDDYVTKPVDKVELLAKIKGLLG
jgi:CheY-like chemotaxis protein